MAKKTSTRKTKRGARKAGMKDLKPRAAKARMVVGGRRMISMP